MIAIFLALLLPAAASAQIRTAKPSEKTVILERIALGLKAEKDMRKLHADAKAAITEGDEDAFLRLMSQAVEAERGMHEHLNRAIGLAVVAYRIGPEVGAGDQIIANGPLQGTKKKYSPVFAPSTARKVREVESDDSFEKRYLRFEPTLDTMGETWEDGAVMVLLQAFKTAQKDGNPGVVAAILHHEAVHFNDLVTVGWHTTEENERHAYEEGLKTAAVFELSKQQTAFFKKAKNEHARAIWLNENVPFTPALHHPFPNAAQEDQNRRDFEYEQTHKPDFELDREKLREIQETRQASRDAADKDHDERLRNTLIDLVQRSCADPGSITQSELDGLPTPFRENFFYADPATGELPEGLGNCAALYLSLGRGARLDAEEVRRQSVAISPDQVARQPVPVVAVPAATQPPPPFSTVLASLKEFSVTACREPERVELDSFLFRLYDHAYRDYDDNLAKDLAINLDQCSRRLFYQMIGIIRAREPRQLLAIDRQWIRTTVAAFLKVPDSSPGYVPPSSGGGGGRRCEEYGNIRCP